MRSYLKPLLALALALASPATAHAHVAIVAMALQPPAAAVAMAGANSQCIAITYDKNGNRISQTVGNVTTTTTIWGSATYGCFIWKP